MTEADAPDVFHWDCLEKFFGNVVGEFTDALIAGDFFSDVVGDFGASFGVGDADRNWDAGVAGDGFANDVAMFFGDGLTGDVNEGFVD